MTRLAMEHEARVVISVYEPYAHLYVGDYFADTMHLSAQEHRAFRLLLLHVWMDGIACGDDDATLAVLTGPPIDDWKDVRSAVLPLFIANRASIVGKVNELRNFAGRRLPPSDWLVVRSIIFERDGYVCTYCGARKELQGDHVVPLGRGGSNTFNNVITACKPCNQSKGSKTPEEWRSDSALGAV